MASETIVAVFSSTTQAEAAVADLVASGVPSSSIRHYARDETAVDGPGSGDIAAETDTQQHHGFWAWLTGQDTTHEHHAAYDRSIQSGRTVVTVITDAADTDQIYATLERHDPVDLDEHAGALAGESGYAAGGTTTGTAASATTARTQFTDTAIPGYADTATPGYLDATASGRGAVPGAATGLTGAGPATGNSEEVLSLSEETLQVGKRAIDRGTTRIRRYVVEHPVEEQVRLRDETVSVLRRPATPGSTISDAFSNREVVMQETGEEAVVAKSAHVVEEVVVHKDVQDRVETVRDTVRHEEVEIDGPAGSDLNPGRKPGGLT